MALGLLEAITRAIGEVLNELGGLRFTRVVMVASEGDVSINVETTFEWATAGVVFIRGQSYVYSGITATAITGLSYFEGTTEVLGLREDVGVTEQVLDFSRIYSDIDKLRASFFVDTAVGADLSVVGRNIGVDRPPTLSDDEVFREIIKALAYTPKGTIFALEVALTAFFGAGNFVVFEDLVNRPNTVFIQITGSSLSLTQTSQAKTYLGLDIPLALDDVASELTLPEASLVGIFVGALLDDEELEQLLGATDLPSVLQEIRFLGDAGIAVWTFSGTGAEGVEVTPVATDSGASRFNITGGAASAFYNHFARIQPESNAYFDNHLRFAALTANGDQNWSMDMEDGARLLRIAFEDGGGGNVAVGFGDSAGNFISGSTNFTADEYATYAIRKTGTQAVELLRNNVVVQTLAHASFSVSADTNLTWGVTAATELPDVFVKSVNFFAHTDTDFWNERGTVADVNTAAPSTLDTNSAALIVGDVGKSLRTFASQVLNAAGGNNNGQWQVDTFIDSDNVTLTGLTKQLAFVETVHPGRVSVANDADAFSYPDDQGKTLEILGGGPNAGDVLVTHVVDPVTGFPFAGLIEEQGSRCLVVGAVTGNSGTDGAVLAANPDRFVDAVYNAFVVGDVGRLILVRTAGNGVNAGVFQITAFISTSEVELNNVSIGQSFVDESSITWEMRETTGYVTETGLEWRLKPNFVTEVGTLSWELTDAGTVVGVVGTLRTNPPFNFANIELIMRVRYTMVLSAQLIPSETIPTVRIPATDPAEYTNYPFFMPANVLGAFEGFVDELTVAGVIPELVF